MSVVSVAIDAGPLHGHRTGIGNAVAWTFQALGDRSDVDLQPYVLSARARVRSPERRLPIPAAAAHRWWAHGGASVDRLLRRGREHPPQVVHGTNYVVPPSRLARLVSVYDCWFLEHPELAQPDVGRAAQVLRRNVADGATVVACSTATAERVRALLGTDRVETVLLGPPMPDDVAPRRPEVLQSDAPYILSLGTLEMRKNVTGLLRSFERITRELASAQLVIAGADGDESGSVTRTMSELDPAVRSRVHRLGTVTAAEKAWLLDNARVLAYPSRDEGFGFPILEAQRVGTPVVATAAGSIPEVAGTGALLSSPGDVEALAANLHWVLTSDDMHDTLRRRGEANIGRFSWQQSAAQLAGIYRRLSEEHS